MANIYDILDPPKTPVPPQEAAPPQEPDNIYDRLDPRPSFPEYAPGGNGQPTRITVRPKRVFGPDDEVGTNSVVQKNSMVAPTSTGAALGVGAVNGATANFADEFYGLVKAGGGAGEGSVLENIALGINPGKTAATGIMALARLGYEAATGQKGEATQAYEEARDKWRRTTAQAEEQHPAATLTGNIAGGVTLPGLAAARAAPLAIRVARGSITGAGVGAVSGVGAGEDLADRAVQGGAGAITGAVAGAVAVPIGELVSRGISAVGRYAGQLYRGFRDPDAEAARRVAQEVVDAQTRGGNDVVPAAQMAARQAEGQPVTNLDIAGQGGRNLARDVRNIPGADDGTQALQGMVQDRFHSQAERTAAFIDRNTPWKNGVDFERVSQANRSANAPAYRQSYADGRAVIGSQAAGNYNPNAFLTTELKRLARAPDIAEVLFSGRVARKEGNRTIIEGFQSPGQSPFAQDANGNVVARQFPNGNRAIPDLPAWDQVQRSLGEKARAAAQAGELDTARQLNLLRNDLNSELDRIVPSFATARGTAWRGFRAEDAYEAGINYVSSSASGREAEAMRRQIANATPAERHLFAAGFAQSLIDRVNKTGDSADVVRRINNSPEARRRIEESIGPQMAREIQAFLNVEQIMNYGRNKVMGNSSTVAQLLSYGMAGNLAYGATSGDWNVLHPANLLAGAAAAGGRRAMTGAQANLANRIGEMLASGDPRVFARGITVLSNSNNLLQNLRTAVDRIASRGPPQQAGGVAGEAARGIMRADDNHEPVPRPAN